MNLSENSRVKTLFSKTLVKAGTRMEAPIMIHFKIHVSVPEAGTKNYIKTVIIQDEKDYEVAITYPIDAYIQKTITAIVIYDEKMLRRAFAAKYYPSNIMEVQRAITELIRSDFAWLFQKQHAMCFILRAISALRRVLEDTQRMV